MARPIDEKIVRMTLDNAKFKDNVKDTLRSFGEINDATRKAGFIDLSNIAKGIATIEDRFSASGVVIASIIKRITDGVIDMGKKLYHATIGQITEGGMKRALNIEQAKFQFEGLGMDVEATMKSANDAVLGTAFGLDEAAVVASQFGATGMRAGQDMTDALRGISGVAAMTGSSYSDIGNIFTTVAGNGRLMGNDLLRLGSRGINAAATLAKAFDTTEEEIRSMVSKGQISFEDFAKAMNDAFGEHATKANETYTGSLSNLRAALSRIGASFASNKLDYMRDIFNSITPKVNEFAKAIAPVIEAFNTFSREVADGVIKFFNNLSFDRFVELGGITNIVESFWNVMNFGKNIIKALSEGFKRIFPNSFTDTLFKLTEGLVTLTSKLNMSSETTDKFATIFAGVFSIFSTVFEIAKVLATAIFGIIPKGIGGGVLDFIVLIADMAIAFNESVKEGNFLTTSIEGLGKVIGGIVSWFKTPLKALGQFVRGLRDTFGPVVEWVIDKLKILGGWIAESFEGFGMDELLGGGLLVGIIMFLKKLSGFFDDVKGNLSNITGVIKGVFDDLGGALKSFQEQVKYKNLLLIAISIGILAVSLKMLEGMDIVDITTSIAALTGTMAILAGGMMAIEKLNFTGGFRASATIIALATAVTIMAGALKKVSDLDIKEISVGLLGLAGIVAILTSSMIVLSKFGGKIGSSSLSLIALATAVSILASSVKKMSDIDTGSLLISVGALGIIFAELALFMLVVKGSKIGPGTAIGLIGLATSINIIVSAISKISEINVKGLSKGLIAIGIILAEIALFSKVAGGVRIMAAGVGITLIATALSLLMIPVSVMGKMSWEQLAKGLGGMAVALLAVAAIGPLASGAILGAVGITAMAIALNLLMPPILIFSTMSWSSLLKGFVGLAGSLGVLAGVALLLAPAAVPMLAFAGAVTLLGIAVGLVGVGIAAFGIGMTALAGLTATSIAAIISSIRTLIRGFTSMITDIVEFGSKLGTELLKALRDMIPLIMQIVGDIASALIDGLITFIGEKVPKAAEAFAKAILSILKTIANYIQDFVEAGFDIMIGFIRGIQEKGPELMKAGAEAIVDLIVGMADAISENRKPMVDAMVRLMGEVILLVIEAGAGVIKALFGWIPGVEGAMESVTSSAEDYMSKHFGTGEIAEMKGEEFADALEGTGGLAMDAGESVSKQGLKGLSAINYSPAGVENIEEYEKGMDSKKNDIKEAAKGVSRFGVLGIEAIDYIPSGKKSGDEYSKGMTSTSKQVEKAGVNLASRGRIGVRSISLLTNGKTFGNSFVRGTSSNSGMAKTAGVTLATSGRTGARSVGLRPVGTNFGNSFAYGISDSRQLVISRAQGIASAASRTVKNWLGIASPSKLLTSYGTNFSGSFAGGILSKMGEVISSAGNVAKGASNAIETNLEDVQPDVEEIRFRVVVDDQELRDLDPRPQDIIPDIRTTRDLVAQVSPRTTHDVSNDSKTGSREADNNEELLEVTKEQNTILRGILNKNSNVILNDRVVGRELEPTITEIQQRNIDDKNRFID